MDNISNSDYSVSLQLKHSWSPHQPHCQPFFSNELGVNFEFEFCNNIWEKFNGVMSYITYSVVLHVHVRWRSQISLAFNRLQAMYSVLSVVLYIEIYKGLFLTQYHRKEQGKTSF